MPGVGTPRAAAPPPGPIHRAALPRASAGAAAAIRGLATRRPRLGATGSAVDPAGRAADAVRAREAGGATARESGDEPPPVALPPPARRRAATPSAAAPASPPAGTFAVDEDARAFWAEALGSMDRGAARRLLPLLDLSQLCGIPASYDGPSGPGRLAPAAASRESSTDAPAPLPGLSFAPRARTPPLLSLFRQLKLAFPKHVALVQVGEFFETVGIDAALLVNHAGLNVMGDPAARGGVPCAGCPLSNLERTLHDLVQGAGFSVVVCRETKGELIDAMGGEGAGGERAAAPGVSGAQGQPPLLLPPHSLEGFRRFLPEPLALVFAESQRTAAKPRHIAGVVTPASPHLLAGLGSREHDVAVESAPPLLAVCARTAGHTLVELHADLRLALVTEGLTEDAVSARIAPGEASPPLLVLDARGAGGGASAARVQRVWEARAREAFGGGKAARVAEAAPVGGPPGRTAQPTEPLPPLAADPASPAPPPAAPLPQAASRVVQRFQVGPGADVAAAALRAAALAAGLGPGARLSVSRRSAGDRPRPLYLSTASALGLHPGGAARGSPPLAEAALPPDAPAQSRAWLRRLLLLPPSPRAALAVSAACEALERSETAVPDVRARSASTAADVRLKLASGEANAGFFRELAALCDGVRALLLRPDAGDLALRCLEVACEDLGAGAAPDGGAVLDAVTRVRGAIGEVVELWDGGGAGGIEAEAWIGGRVDEGVEGDFQRAGRSPSDAEMGTPDWHELLASAGPSLADDGKSLSALASMFNKQDARFRGRVREGVLGEAAEAVRAARARTAGELVRAAASLQAASRTAGDVARLLPTLRGSEPDGAVWIKVPSGASAAVREALAALGASHPRDRFGRPERGFYSTPAAEDAQADLRAAVEGASRAVRDSLRSLAARLEPRVPELAAAAGAATVLGALDAHVREARRRGWCAPELLFDAAAAAGAERARRRARVAAGLEPAGADPWCGNAGGEARGGAGGDEGALGEDSPHVDPGGRGRALSLEGLWPYWMDEARDAPVKNDVTMEGMLLLTGPNMAGKSTLLRAVAGASVLAACGLRVPATSAQVPYADAFVLRTFSGDAPLEGASGFALEAEEVRYVLEDAGPSSLVLLDELGKGTEASAGAAIAGALLESLDAVGARGALATHLHTLLEAPLDLSRTQRWKMGVERRRTLRAAGGARGGGVEGAGRDPAAGNSIDSPEGLPYDEELVPTWRLEPGSCTESLALQVARDAGLPAALLQRAGVLYDTIRGKEETIEVEDRIPVWAGLGDTGAGGARASGRPDAGEGAATPATPAAAAAAAASAAREPPLPSPRAGTSRSKTLAAAASLLASSVSATLAALGCEDAVAAPRGGATPGQPLPLVPLFVPRGHVPPPRVVGASCVYVARSTSGGFYVGQSEDLGGRVEAHRRSSGQSKVRDPLAEFAFVEIPAGAGGASAAKAAEAAAITALSDGGFPLLSQSDSAYKRRPRKASSARAG